MLVTSIFSFSHNVFKKIRPQVVESWGLCGKQVNGAIFSSPEHNVLKGSFKGVDVSVINNFFKHLLLPNHWANLDQTWQECSLGGPLQKLFTEFDSIKNSGCHGNEIEFFKQFSKNHLLWNRRSDFEMISQKCSLGDPFKNCF